MTTKYTNNGDLGVYRSMQWTLKALPYKADKCSEDAV